MFAKFRSRSIYAGEVSSRRMGGKVFLIILTALASFLSFTFFNACVEAGFEDKTSLLRESQSLSLPSAPPVIVTAPTANQAPAGSFVVPVMFSDTTGDGIIGFQFNLDYNPAVIDPSSAGNFGCSTAGTISANLQATCNVTTQGTLRVVVFGAQPLSGAGTALNIVFTVDQSAVAGNFSPLVFRNLLLENSSGAVASAPANGRITLVGEPSPAGFTVGGRVLTAAGTGIENALITMTDARGVQRSTLSTSFGFFRFNEVAANEKYAFKVKARRFIFFRPMRVLTVNDNFYEMDFVADN